MLEWGGRLSSHNYFRCYLHEKKKDAGIVLFSEIHVQASVGTSLDIWKCGQQPKHSRNRVGAIEKKFCQISMETSLSRCHRYTSDATHGFEFEFRRR